MAKKPKASAPAPNPLLEQLRFVASILSKKGEPSETHCIIANGKITAVNKPLSVGILTDTDFDATLDAHQLIAALERCKEGYALSNVRGMVTLNGGALRVNLPTLKEQLHNAQPDGYYAPLDPKLLETVGSIVGIADDNAEYIEAASICIEEGLASALNSRREVLLQAYHGLNMPTMMIPVSFFKRLLALPALPTGWGHSERSFTVFFDNNSWVKTQLNDCQPLPYSAVVSWDGEWQNMPDIWEALETVMPFRGNSVSVRFGTGSVYTDTANHDAQWPWSNVIRINADFLKSVKSHIEHFAIDDKKFYFKKGNVRGAIMLMQN